MFSVEIMPWSSPGTWVSNANSYQEFVEIEKFIGADSLEYISIEGLHKAMKSKGYCDACFTGNYPVKKQLATNS